MKKKNKKSENVIITVSSFTVTASQSSLTPLTWDRVLHLHIDLIFGAFARFRTSNSARSKRHNFRGCYVTMTFTVCQSGVSLVGSFFGSFF